ncbi:MAG: hypothetical protein K0S47_3247 [Herbinix sp.]|jgi:hypothetical protein|nr:hypothetical protein [Herbinix sp.]
MSEAKNYKQIPTGTERGNIMRLIRNYNPLWSKKHLEFFRKYQKSYGIIMTDAFFNKEFDNITYGKPTERCNADQQCYEIHVNDLYVGDIIIIDNEIDILIFDEYSGNGYAYSAIKLFVENYYKCKTSLEAVVRGENCEKDKIKSVLNKLGFIHNCTSSEGNEIWIY